jgi:hypothetical protein
MALLDESKEFGILRGYPRNDQAATHWRRQKVSVGLPGELAFRTRNWIPVRIDRRPAEHFIDAVD